MSDRTVETLKADLTAAEARGYNRAVESLRTDPALRRTAAAAMADQSWSGKQISEYHAKHLTRVAIASIVDYLEAQHQESP